MFLYASAFCLLVLSVVSCWALALAYHQIFHVLKVRYHCMLLILGGIYVLIVLQSFYSMVGKYLVIFAVQPAHFVWGKFIFFITAAHWLKVECHYFLVVSISVKCVDCLASFSSKHYSRFLMFTCILAMFWQIWNVWIVPLPKIKMPFAVRPLSLTVIWEILNSPNRAVSRYKKIFNRFLKAPKF